MVELTIDGQIVSIYKPENLRFNKQISDIFNISEVKASFTNQFKIPKTQENTKVLRGLGIVGLVSDMPYRKVSANISYKGIPIVENGWLQIVSMNDKFYNVNVIDGAIDFFKLIENKTIGKDLDLSELSHEKTVQTVKQYSNINNPILYIFGDYGGKNTADYQLNGQWNKLLNIDYQVPSVKRKFLLDKIAHYTGYTVVIPQIALNELNKEFITYPQEPTNQFSYTFKMSGDLPPINNAQSIITSGTNVLFLESTQFINLVINAGTMYGRDYAVNEYGGYKVTLKAKGWVDYTSFGTNRVPLQIVFKKGNNVIERITLDVNDEGDHEFERIFNAQEILSFSFETLYRTGSAEAYKIRLETFEMKVERLEGGSVSFSNVFQDFSMRDFIKEITTTFGLTPLVDNATKRITFYTLEQRINRINSKDFSDKYVRKIEHTYSANSYAQRNRIGYLYNQQESENNDGFLIVDNANLQDEKELLKSKFYSPTSTVSTIDSLYLGNVKRFISPQYLIWEAKAKEVDVDGEKSVEVEYKGLNNRFNLIKAKAFQLDSYIVSENAQTRNNINTIYIIDDQDSLYNETIPRRLAVYDKVLNPFESVKLELALTITDIINLDFIYSYYFEQESAYFLLNSVQFQVGKNAICEFIKINQ